MKVGITRWDEQIEVGERNEPAGELEMRDLARGMAGALFVSLPLLFTLEMWQISRTIPNTVLLVFLAISIGINRLFIEFSGYRRRQWHRSPWWDSIIALGIGIVASAVTLLVAGIISPTMAPYLMIKTIALEAIPTSMGAAVATNQLGGGDRATVEQTRLSPDSTVIVGSLLGGFLFAFNVAPTMETKYIVMKQDWWLVGATFLLSVLVAYLAVAVANFEERDLECRKIITSEWLETAIAYVVAFAISTVLLWTFGYGTPLDPIEVWLPQAVVLTYATSLGGAAGRLVL